MNSSLRSTSRAYWLGSLDPRPLGLFRITFGLAALGSVLDIAPILTAGFSDEGFWPRSALLAAVPWSRVSLMDIVGPPWLAVAYWLATVAAAISFVVGYRTRLATLAFLVLYHGLIERNRMLFDTSDAVIRMLLVNAIFLPLGARYSLDAILRRHAGDEPVERIPALGVRLLALQFCFIYLASFLAKTGESWWDGSAVHRTLGLEHIYTRALGRFLDGFPAITRFSTHLTLVIEATFLPLVFLPVLQPRAKAIALVGGFVLHAGIWATLCIGSFSWVMVAAYPLLFEPAWADWVVTRALGFFGRNPMVRVSRQSEPHPTAILPPARPALRLLGVGIVAAGLWCSAPKLGERMPAWAQGAIQGIGLGSPWTMFAPDPPAYDSWIRGVGKLADGTNVDVLRGHEAGGPLRAPKHGVVFSRWAAVDERMPYSGQLPLLEFGRFVCRTWNVEPRPGRPLLKTFRLFSVSRRVEAIGKPKNPWTEDLVWVHQC